MAKKVKKANYKNWMPKGMVASVSGGAVLALFVTMTVFYLMPYGTWKTALMFVLSVTSMILCGLALWACLMYRAFSYNGKRRMSEQIIEGIAEYVSLPDEGKGLDIGCGSGALTIACAKRNPFASFIGIDLWSKEYASFSKMLCENNAETEGVHNVTFARGDATSLDFPDESFDAVTSNYVYHNIPSANRQAILLETLRVLKKGGIFALHDIFSKSKYGDMQAFTEKLKNMGFECVELIDTTDGKFMSKLEAAWTALSGSALLLGRK